MPRKGETVLAGIAGHSLLYGLAAATLAIVLLTVPFTFTAWHEWIGVLTGRNLGVADAQASIPFLPRAGLAVGIVAYAGRTDRLWLVPIAAAIGVPIPNDAHWTMALASIRLALRRPTAGGEAGAGNHLGDHRGRNERIWHRIGALRELGAHRGRGVTNHDLASVVDSGQRPTRADRA